MSGGATARALPQSPGSAPPSAIPAIAATGKSGGKTRHPGIAIASFVLGAATAATVVLYIEPLRDAVLGVGPGRTSAARPAKNEATKIESATIEPSKGETAAIAAADAVKAEPTATQSAKAESAKAESANAEPTQVDVATAAPSVSPEPRVAEPAAVNAQAGNAVIDNIATPPRTETLTTAPSESPAAPRRLVLAQRLEGVAGDVTPFPLRLQPMAIERDAQLVVLRGVPQWLTLSKGSALGNEIWLIPAHTADELLFYVSEGSEGEARIRVELSMLDGKVLSRVETTVIARKAAGQPYVSTPLASIPQPVARSAREVIVQLLARADLLLDTGDLSAARELYKTAAESGSAGGALKLGETYDPTELQRLGMTHGAADEATARRWYELAHTLGSLQAADRLTALKPR